MSSQSLDAAKLAKLRDAAAVLIPVTAVMPPPAGIASFDDLLQRAVRVGSWDRKAIEAAIEDVPDDPNWDRLRNYQQDRPTQFGLVSRLVAAAYLMAPEVLRALSYPTDRRHPAGLDEFAAEFESGVLTPLLDSPPRFRDPRQGPD